MVLAALAIRGRGLRMRVIYYSFFAAFFWRLVLVLSMKATSTKVNVPSEAGHETKIIFIIYRGRARLSMRTYVVVA